MNMSAELSVPATDLARRLQAGDRMNDALGTQKKEPRK